MINLHTIPPFIDPRLLLAARSLAALYPRITFQQRDEQLYYQLRPTDAPHRPVNNIDYWITYGNTREPEALTLARFIR